MISNEKYVILSLELHLFFSRIMKEHSIFLEAGFTPKNTKLSKESDNFKVQFEKILLEAVKMSSGVVREEVINSGEIYTEYTLKSESMTEYYTGIAINQDITKLAQKLSCKKNNKINNAMIKCIKELNKKALIMLDGLIDLKCKVLNDMLSCKLFTVNYPLLIEHIIREARLYRSYVMDLECKEDIEENNIREKELFWNQIMMEHALFIRGLLDPSEEKLIEASDNFAKEYKELLKKARNMTDETIDSITNETLDETLKLRGFKAAGTKGLDECEIKSIMVPLLADHVLRESNHYIRILNQYKNAST